MKAAPCSMYPLMLTAILLLPACSEQSPPQAAGLDLAPLQELDAEIRAGKHGYIDGVLVLHRGEIVFETRYEQDYQTPYDEYVAAGTRDGYWGEAPYHYLDPEWHPWLRGSDLHSLQSVTKSVASALIGIAIEQGAIPSVDVEVARYFDHPAPFGGDPRAVGLTLHELLTMSAGIDWDEQDYSADSNDCIIMERSEDWVAYVLGKGLSDEPGAVFNYNSGISVLLDQILWKATGLHADQFAERHLFGPLGIDDYYWKTTPTGIVDTEGGLYLSPRSLARIGQLYAADGVWNGQRIFPEGWVEASFSPAIGVGRDDWQYGYQWWLSPAPNEPQRLIPSARGYGGQYLLILDREDIIAVLNGWNVHPDKTPIATDGVIERLLAAAGGG